jgi:hypothetical protein
VATARLLSKTVEKKISANAKFYSIDLTVIGLWSAGRWDENMENFFHHIFSYFYAFSDFYAFFQISRLRSTDRSAMLKFIWGKGHQPTPERLKIQKELFGFNKVSLAD